MKTNSAQMVNGAPQEMVYDWQRQITPSDIIERWYIEGEGGNSTVRYTPYFATRGQAEGALANGCFPLCPIGVGPKVSEGGLITFQVRQPIPYSLVGERITNLRLDEFGRIASYSKEAISVTRIVDGRLTDALDPQP